MGVTEAERANNLEWLDLAWSRLVDAAWSDPETVSRLQLELADALDDPRRLGELDPPEAALAARLAHLGMGELLSRCVGARRAWPGDG